MNELAPGIALANPLSPTSWLNDPRFRWFRDGYLYAQMQTRAIPALASVSPEDLYFAVVSVLHGAKRAGHEADVPDKGVQRAKPD